MEFPYHPAKRVYLARCTSNKILLVFSVNLLKSNLCITLYILASNRLNKLLNSSCYIMLSPLLSNVIATTNCFVALFYKLFAYFKTNPTRGAFTSDLLIVTPCCPTLYWLVILSQIIMIKRTHIKAYAAIDTCICFLYNRLIKAMTVKLNRYDFLRA